MLGHAPRAALPHAKQAHMEIIRVQVQTPWQYQGPATIVSTPPQETANMQLR